jgi:hypothetical protein
VVRKATRRHPGFKAHMELDGGEAVFNHACRMGLGGICPSEDSTYRSGRSPEGLGSMRDNPGAQYEISVDGVPRTHRDRPDIALQSSRIPTVWSR